MKLLAFFFLFAFSYSALYSQTTADTAVTELRQLLKPGIHLVHYYRADPSQSFTPEQKALLVKVDKALAENTAWVLHPDSTRQLAGTKDEILDDIRKKLQLTEQEWNTLQDLTDVAKKNVELYGNDTLEIMASGDQLFFHGTGKASGMDSIFFDLHQNTAIFRQRSIPFMNIFHVPPTANSFHTPCVKIQPQQMVC